MTGDVDAYLLYKEVDGSHTEEETEISEELALEQEET